MTTHRETGECLPNFSEKKGEKTLKTSKKTWRFSQCLRKIRPNRPGLQRCDALLVVLQGGRSLKSLVIRKRDPWLLSQRRPGGPPW